MEPLDLTYRQQEPKMVQQRGQMKNRLEPTMVPLDQTYRRPEPTMVPLDQM